MQTTCSQNRLHNGNCTEWRAIWSEIKRVITKSHDRVAGVRFAITSLISDQNCPTRGVVPGQKEGGLIFLSDRIVVEEFTVLYR